MYVGAACVPLLNKSDIQALLMHVRMYVCVRSA